MKTRAYWPLAGLALAQLLWAGNSILARGTVGEVPPVALSFWRWAVAAAVLLPFVAGRLRAEWPQLLAHAREIALLSLLGVAAFNTLHYIAAQTTTAINVTLINQTLPIATLPLAWWLLGQRPTGRQTLGAALALCGALLIVSRGSLATLTGLGFVPGDLLMVLAVVLWGVYTVLFRRFAIAIDPLALLAATIVLALPVLFPLYLAELVLAGGFHVTPGNLAVIAYIATGPSIAAFLLWNHGVRTVGPNGAAVTNYLHPLFVISLAIPVLGERLVAYHYAGGGLVLAGVALALSGRAPSVRALTPAGSNPAVRES